MINCKSLVKHFSKVLERNSSVLPRLKKTQFSSSSVNSKNHYETLKLSKDCSSKEIREAFISLSKQYHPDKNKNNPKAEEQFVKINEAYSVLNKPESRRDYDFSLQFEDSQYWAYKAQQQRSEYYKVHRYRDPWNDPSFARNRNFWNEGGRNTDDYYGIKGVQRLSNRSLLFWLIVFSGIGLLIQIVIIRISGIRNFAAYDKKTMENQQHLDSVRKRAEVFGSRENQIEEYKRRIGKDDGE